MILWTAAAEIDILTEWPNCETPDCFLKQCTWAGLPHCYPCCEKDLGRPRMQRIWEATHPEYVWKEPKFKEGDGHRWMADYFSRLSERYERMKNYKEDKQRNGGW
jgi:hypothetical protein